MEKNELLDQARSGGVFSGAAIWHSIAFFVVAACLLLMDLDTKVQVTLLLLSPMILASLVFNVLNSRLQTIVQLQENREGDVS